MAQSVSLSKALWRGFAMKCPNCGRGHLFGRFLKVGQARQAAVRTCDRHRRPNRTSRKWKPNVDPSVRSFAEVVFTKLGNALLFAVMLAMATNASLVKGLRFISVICLLISSWHFGAAFARRRPLSVLSEWGEAVMFGLIAGCACLYVRLLV
jgi:uncharacterized protein (DUF983 family)